MGLEKHLKKATMLSKSSNVRAAQVAKVPTDKYSHWIDALQTRAHDSNAQAKVSQLRSILDFYHKKPEADSVAEIDWATWKSVIQTPELVDKLEETYKQFQGEEYDVEKIAEQTADNTALYEEFGLHLIYNHALWMTYYLEQHQHLWNVKEVGTLEGASWSEVFHLHKPLEKVADTRWETHDYYPGAHSYDQFGQAVKTQFWWGVKWAKPYKHPCDAFLGLYGTNKLMHM